MKIQKEHIGTRQPLIWYLPKLKWVIIFLAIGLSLLTLEKKLFFHGWFQFHICLIEGECSLVRMDLGHVLLDSFILAIVFWFKGAFNRYKLWKNWMFENNKPIKWYDLFRF